MPGGREERGLRGVGRSRLRGMFGAHPLVAAAGLATWYCAHLVLKILAPASEKREGVAVSGPTQRDARHSRGEGGKGTSQDENRARADAARTHPGGVAAGGSLRERSRLIGRWCSVRVE